MRTRKTSNFVNCLLTDRYLFTDLLGQGRWGSVYRARDILSHICAEQQTHYAVKCIPNEIIGPSFKQFLWREVHLHRIVSGISPHVVPLRYAFQDSMYLYIVLDICTGGDMLTAMLDDVFYGDDELIRKVFIEILDGIEACHEKGVYHRDLKPENILFREDGTACIADFGLATVDEISSEFGVGTQLYLSPESVKDGIKRRAHPWYRASLSDSYFQHYVYRRNSFFKWKHPMISSCLDRLLQKILHPSPRRRITIPELRKEILSIETFYSPGAI
ncbi:kinase-like domain-containing protein [Scleroderma citrinum]